MLLDIDLAMEYQIEEGGAVLLTLEAARTQEQSLLGETLTIENAELMRIAGESAVGTRVWATLPGPQMRLKYRAKVEITRQAADLSLLRASPLHELPSEVLTYLRPSRFCQSDLFTSFVGQQFQHLDGGAKIMAIVDWVGSEIAYVPGSSNAETTAIDTFVGRAGVCRDFAHLVCSLARASNIPARYTSVYGTEVQPADFHAVAEVWLGSAWHMVDATGMSMPENVAVIGTGRDAADVAFMETERWVEMTLQTVTVSRV